MIDAYQIRTFDHQYFLLIKRDLGESAINGHIEGGYVSYLCSVPAAWIHDLPSAGLIAIDVQGFLLRAISAQPASGEEAAIDEWIRKFKEEYNAASPALDWDRPDP